VAAGAKDGGSKVGCHLLPAVVGAPASNLSERSLADSEAPMGYATTRPMDRVLAACGMLTSAELSSFPPKTCRKAGCCARCRRC